MMDLTFTFEPRDDGGLRIRCKEIPEIYVAGSNPDWVLEDLGTVIQTILVHNHGVQWAMPQCDDRKAWLKAAPVGREA